MLFLTAYNSAFSELGDLCVRSIERNIKLVGRHHLVMEKIPDDFPRKASWYKLDAIRKHLADHDYVFWVDADSMVIGDLDLRAFIENAPLNIAVDCNGVNHGVAAWKNCPEAFCALDLMDKMYPIYKDGKWFEQHALHDIIPILDHHVWEKAVMNAYPEDCVEDTQILHLPGMRNAERLPLMQAEARRLGIL